MLDVDDRRDVLVAGDGERDCDFAVLGDNDRSDCLSFTSEPGVDARELALLKGSDLARMRLRLRAAALLENMVPVIVDYLQRSGGLRASAWWSDFAGSKLACREGGAKSMLISGGDIVSA